MNNKKIIWKTLLLIGLIPFIIVIGYGLFSAISGKSYLCILNCTREYGFVAFRDSIILYSYLFWPTYIIGLFLIIFSIIKLRK